MLVLSRKRSEVIRIGNDISIKVVRTGRNSVKIGVEAPGHVRVLRAELFEEEGANPAEDLFAESGDEDGELAIAYSDQFPYPHIG